MDAVETTGVEVADGDGDACAHQDRIVANLGEVSLAPEPVGGVGVRPLGRQVKFEVVVCAAEAFDQSQSLDGGVGQFDLVQLLRRVLRVGASIRGRVGWVHQGPIVWVVWLHLTLDEIWDNGDGSGEAEARREGDCLDQHVVVLPRVYMGC